MSISNKKLTSLERKAITGLSAIYGLRMFGLFLVLPVLAVYATQLEGSTPFLIGMVLGAYGIAQAVLQIPFGLMSDKFGRKRVITTGLIMFIAGSIVAALASDIYWMIFGRVLQGSGAIAAAVLALTADLTRENQRTKAMAVIGMSIGLSFMLALVVASPLMALFSIAGLFYLTAFLAVLAILALWFYVPNQTQRASRDVKFVATDFLFLFQHAQLWRLNVGIFVLHCVLTAMFVVVPLLLVNRAGLSVETHWHVYLPVLLGSVVLMVPLVIASAKKQLTMRIFTATICVLMLAQVLFFVSQLNNVYSIGFCLLIFFVGFNALEAMLPSLVTRLAPASMKGTAVGIYNTFQFLGVFLGGALGGYLMGNGGEQSVFIFCGLLLVIWAGAVMTAPKASLYDTRLVKLSDDMKIQDSDQRYDILMAVNGVKDVTIVDEEKIVYLKINKAEFSDEALMNIDFLSE